MTTSYFWSLVSWKYPDHNNMSKKWPNRTWKQGADGRTNTLENTCFPACAHVALHYTVFTATSLDNNSGALVRVRYLLSSIELIYPSFLLSPGDTYSWSICVYRGFTSECQTWKWIFAKLIIGQLITQTHFVVDLGWWWWNRKSPVGQKPADVVSVIRWSSRKSDSEILVM